LTSRFIIGQYQPSDSFGHRLDPRSKILTALFLMIVAVFTTSILFYLFIIAGMVLILRLSDMTFGLIFRNIRPFIILIILTALYHLIFSARDSETVARIFGFRLTEGGIYMAVSFSLRVLVFVGIAFFISLTTMPAEMAETLVNWMKPFRRMGIPVNDIGLIVFIAMRYIPVLADEIDTIKKAQIVRGVDFSGGLRKRAKNMIALLIPVFQSAIRRADDLAVAIESRGYISGTERSSYKIFKYRPVDWLFMSGSAAFVILLFLFTRR
jgi:energy-coupling factor transport system permease protein